MWCLSTDCKVVRVTTNRENQEYSGISTNMENSREFCPTSEKILTKKIVSARSDICKTQQGLGLQMNKVMWVSETVTVRWWPVILLESMWNEPWHMKVIVTFTFCCNNLWKSIVYGCGKSLENSGNFFLLLCGHLGTGFCSAMTWFN